MGYKGSDLGDDFKQWFRKEKRRLTAILKEKGCADIKLDYGFYYFSGFFTSSTGQVYYMSCSDVRHFPYKQLLIRTAQHYKDFSGGPNQYSGISKEELMRFRLI